MPCSAMTNSGTSSRQRSGQRGAQASVIGTATLKSPTLSVALQQVRFHCRLVLFLYYVYLFSTCCVLFSLLFSLMKHC